MEKTNNVSALEDHLGLWLRLVSNQVSYAFAAKLEKCKVTVAEWVISKFIERLLNKGLVTRTCSTDDRRYQDIELTRNARLLVPKLAQAADKNEEEFFACLNSSEKKALMATLKKIAKDNKIYKTPVK